MSSKKLSSEVDRVTKELRQQMEIYDEKWQQLRNLCALSAVMSSTAPEEKNSGLKAKKKVGNRPQSVESIDQRSVQDQIARLKNELEAAHKRLYKYRQQMELYANNPDLKNTGKSSTDLLLLKKEIERRGKRGKVFFLHGVSSEVDDGQNMTLESDTVEWISTFLQELNTQSDQFQAELESLTHPAGDDARADQIRAMLDLHMLHMSRLEDILRMVQNKTINRKGHRYDRVKEEIAATNFVAGVEEVDDESQDILADVRDALEPYVNNNDDMSYIVAEEVYDSLTAVDFTEVLPVEEPSSPVVKSPPTKSPSVSKSNSVLIPSNVKSFESATSASSPAVKEKTPVVSKKPPASPPRPNAWSNPISELTLREIETPSGHTSTEPEKPSQAEARMKRPTEDETTDVEDPEIVYKPGVFEHSKGENLIRLRVTRENLSDGEEPALQAGVHAVSICRWTPTESLQRAISGEGYGSSEFRRDRSAQCGTRPGLSRFRDHQQRVVVWTMSVYRTVGTKGSRSCRVGWFPSCAVSVLGSKVIMKLQLLKHLAVQAGGNAQ